MLTVEEIKAEVIRLVGKLGAPAGYVPFYPYVTSDDGCLDFEVDQRGYHVLEIFRGKEKARLTTQDLDEVLYKALRPVVWQLAQEKALAEGALDQAQAHVKHEVALMSVLSPKWGERRAAEFAAEIRIPGV